MIFFVATCPLGAEKVAGEDLKHSGLTLLGNAPGRVRFTGNCAMEKANLLLRAVDRVYIEAAKFFAEDFDALFEGVSAVPWEEYFFKTTKVVIDKVRVHSSTLKSVTSIQSITQKALYERLMKKWGLVSLSESGETATVRVHIEQNEVTLLLDTTGTSLHKRGDKAEGGAAALRETVAFAMLQKMHWKRKKALRDPFCGSGTIPIEAALYAQNVPAGIARNFAFENLAIFNEAAFKKVKEDAAKAVRADITFDIVGSDLDFGAIKTAQKNSKLAASKVSATLKKLGSDVLIKEPRFECCDFLDANYKGAQCTVLCNPPYGKRLGDKEAALKLYEQMASLFEKAKECDIGIISDFEELERILGRRANKNGTLKDGNFDTRFFEFFHTEKNNERQRPKEEA